MSVEQYTIKELAEAKGTSAPVRAALLALEARVLELEEALMRIASETGHDCETQWITDMAHHALGYDGIVLRVKLHTPDGAIAEPVSLHPDLLRGGQQNCILWQTGHAVSMPQKAIETLSEAGKERVRLALPGDVDGKPADLPTTPLDLAAQPVGEQLVSQADGQDGYVGLQGFHDPLSLGLKDGQIKLIGPVFASGKDHGIVAAQIGDRLFQINTDLSVQDSEPREDVVYDQRARRSVDERNRGQRSPSWSGGWGIGGRG